MTVKHQLMQNTLNYTHAEFHNSIISGCLKMHRNVIKLTTRKGSQRPRQSTINFLDISHSEMFANKYRFWQENELQRLDRASGPSVHSHFEMCTVSDVWSSQVSLYSYIA